MESKEYLEAKKEFWNCIAMTIFGLGVPLYNAFREWLPIMRAEKKKRTGSGGAGGIMRPVDKR